MHPGETRVPDTRLNTSISVSFEPTFVLRARPTPILLEADLLEHLSRTPLLVVPLSNEIFPYPKEVTHGDFARFEIFEPEESKKHLLNHVLGTLRADQSSNEGSKRPVMILVERANHDPAGLRNPL